MIYGSKDCSKGICNYSYDDTNDNLKIWFNEEQKSWAWERFSSKTTQSFKEWIDANELRPSFSDDYGRGNNSHAFMDWSDFFQMGVQDYLDEFIGQILVAGKLL
jgi:hypothetical protein